MKEITILIHHAYYKTLGINFDKDKIKYIAWQRHRPTNNFDVYLLNKYFKKIIFVTPIRHPSTSLDALIYSKQTCKQSIKIENFIEAFLSTTVHSYPKEVGLQIYLRFEDLHDKSNEVISALASLLDIDKENSLFQTTLNGKPYFFTSGNKLITGFNKNIFNKPIRLKALLSDDIKKIEESCKKLLKEFNYVKIGDLNLEKNKNSEENIIKIIKKKDKKRILILGSTIYPLN